MGQRLFHGGQQLSDNSTAVDPHKQLNTQKNGHDRAWSALNMNVNMKKCTFKANGEELTDRFGLTPVR